MQLYCIVLVSYIIYMICIQGTSSCNCGCGSSKSCGYSVTPPVPVASWSRPDDPYDGVSFVVRPAELPKPTISMPGSQYPSSGYIQPVSYCSNQQQLYIPDCGCNRKSGLLEKLMAFQEKLKQQRLAKYEMANKSCGCGCCQKQTCNCGCRSY